MRKAMELSLSEKELALLLRTAREAVQAKLENRGAQFLPCTDALQKKYGVFVTFRKNGDLRGCIGTMRGEGALYEAVKKMALSSAFHDPRFPGITRDELDQVSIEISILSPLERIQDVKTITVGKHGIYIVKGSYTGVLLPQVATEQGWNREQFLTNSCRKAGLHSNAWRDSDIAIYVFSALICSEHD